MTRKELITSTKYWEAQIENTEHCKNSLSEHIVKRMRELEKLSVVNDCVIPDVSKSVCKYLGNCAKQSTSTCPNDEVCLDYKPTDC